MHKISKKYLYVHIHLNGIFAYFCIGFSFGGGGGDTTGGTMGVRRKMKARGTVTAKR
jgi:hypothetical protein